MALIQIDEDLTLITLPHKDCIKTESIYDGSLGKINKFRHSKVYYRSPVFIMIYTNEGIYYKIHKEYFRTEK